MEAAVSIIWSETAERNLQEAYDYLRISSEKAAGQFVDGMLDLIESLRTHPGRHGFCLNPTLQKAKYRCAKFKGYILIYRIADPSEVYLVAIIHEKRHPSRFSGLLGKK